jgi:hypothetical protein
MLNPLDLWPSSYRWIQAASEEFGGIGREGLVTVIVIGVLLIVVVVWILNGLRSRD